jgi:hypothetical protein
MTATDPCRRHLVVGCDIQRCAEERLGRPRTAHDDGAYARARAELAAMRRTRKELQAVRRAQDEAYREVAGTQPVPTGHTNHPGAMRQWRRR